MEKNNECQGRSAYTRSELMRDRFICLLNKKGECWVNYLLGASYRFQLIDGAICQDGGRFYNYCGEMSNEEIIDNIDFVGVASITENDIRKF